MVNFRPLQICDTLKTGSLIRFVEHNWGQYLRSALVYNVGQVNLLLIGTIYYYGIVLVRGTN